MIFKWIQFGVIIGVIGLSHSVVFAAAQVNASKEAPQKQYSEHARQVYRQGLECFKKGEYKKSAVLFREAYAETQITGLIFNIAQCEYLNKEYGIALELFQRYLDTEVDVEPESQAESFQSIEELKKYTAELHVFASNGCELTVNGFARGKAPFLQTIYIDAEKIQTIVVVCNTKEVYKDEVTLSVGAHKKIDIVSPTKEKLPPQKKVIPSFKENPVRSKKSLNRVLDNKKKINDTQHKKSNESVHDNEMKIVLPVTIAAASVACLGTSIFLIVKTRARLDEIESSDTSSAYYDTTQRFQFAARLTGVVGLVGAGISAWLFARYFKKKQMGKKRNALHFVPIVSPQMNGILFEGRFFL